MRAWLSAATLRLEEPVDLVADPLAVVVCPLFGIGLDGGGNGDGVVLFDDHVLD